MYIKDMLQAVHIRPDELIAALVPPLFGVKI